MNICHFVLVNRNCDISRCINDDESMKPPSKLQFSRETINSLTFLVHIGMWIQLTEKSLY